MRTRAVHALPIGLCLMLAAPALPAFDVPWHVFRTEGDAPCEPSGVSPVAVSMDGRVAVGQQCSGAFLQVFNDDGTVSSSARRDSQPFWSPPDTIDRVVALADGRFIAVGRGHHDAPPATPERCEAWLPMDDGRLEPFSLPIAGPTLCGDASAMPQGGLVFSGTTLGRHVGIRNVDHVGATRWRHELRADAFPAAGVTSHALTANGSDVFVAFVDDDREVPGERVLVVRRIGDDGKSEDRGRWRVDEHAVVFGVVARGGDVTTLYRDQAKGGPVLRLARISANAPPRFVDVSHAFAEMASIRQSASGRIVVAAAHRQVVGSLAMIIAALDHDMTPLWTRSVDGATSFRDVQIDASGRIVLATAPDHVIRLFDENGVPSMRSLPYGVVPEAARFVGDDVIVVGGGAHGTGGDLFLARTGADGSFAWQTDEGVQPHRTLYRSHARPEGSLGLIVATETTQATTLSGVDAAGTLVAMIDARDIQAMPVDGTSASTAVIAVPAVLEGAAATTIVDIDVALRLHWRDTLPAESATTILRAPDGGAMMLLADALTDDGPPGVRTKALARYDVSGNRLFFRSFTDALPAIFGIAIGEGGAWVYGRDYAQTPPDNFVAAVDDEGNVVRITRIPTVVDGVDVNVGHVRVDGDSLSWGVDDRVAKVARHDPNGALVWSRTLHIDETNASPITRFGADGRMWVVWRINEFGGGIRYQVMTVSPDGAVSDMGVPLQLVHGIDAVTLDDADGLLLAGVAAGDGYCGAVAASRIDRHARVSWTWVRRHADPGCDVAYDLASVGTDVVVFANSTVRAEPRRTVAFRFESPLFGNGFE